MSLRRRAPVVTTYHLRPTRGTIPVAPTSAVDPKRSRRCRSVVAGSSPLAWRSTSLLHGCLIAFVVFRSRRPRFASDNARACRRLRADRACIQHGRHRQGCRDARAERRRGGSRMYEGRLGGGRCISAASKAGSSCQRGNCQWRSGFCRTCRRERGQSFNRRAV
jgi:hypothetical protein